ncbi:hypothetical protein cce_4359 [Crocosphaera subtropica ATCC 51142]|uniref:HNH nuclease domain-containing protein n=1 Tax=Crocosphaera subtropica (strain ATCC 51142 / BH68) TaxID=43989 RepID=B1WTJ2_CROS5|nr:HNH endonuclease [Crocosphaera subtropica]ACB53707.1 hypothetical protein cce_4359 [Crocosphaera subtropica ATCC 51142]
MESKIYKTRFISTPKRGRNWIPKIVRTSVYERDDYTCQYCQMKVDNHQLTIEHIMPVIKGGIDDIRNYITGCRSCNSSKKDKLLTDFLSKKLDINIKDLPIHGDIIIDTPELDEDYRHIRYNTYHFMRKYDLFKGSRCLNKLEKLFRQNLWSTEYGKLLAKRYPELPGQVVAVIPLVEYIVSDFRVPIYKLLVEFCKSAQTRALIDNIIRIVSNTNDDYFEDSINAIIFDKYDEKVQKKIQQAAKRAKVDFNKKTLWTVETQLLNAKVQERDLLYVHVEKKRDNFGIVYVEDYEIRIPDVEIGQKIEIYITKIHSNYAEAKIAKLPVWISAKSTS